MIPNNATDCLTKHWPCFLIGTVFFLFLCFRFQPNFNMSNKRNCFNLNFNNNTANKTNYRPVLRDDCQRVELNKFYFNFLVAVTEIVSFLNFFELRIDIKLCFDLVLVCLSKALLMISSSSGDHFLQRDDEVDDCVQCIDIQSSVISFLFSSSILCMWGFPSFSDIALDLKLSLHKHDRLSAQVVKLSLMVSSTVFMDIFALVQIVSLKGRSMSVNCSLLRPFRELSLHSSSDSSPSFVSFL